MRITTDPVTGAVYILIHVSTVEKTITRTVTEHKFPLINVDYDKHNQPVGIEILPIWKNESRSDLS